MEQFLETIDLDIEEANELLFKVKVQGIDQAPAKVRLVIEEGSETALMFNGNPTPDEGVVQFLLPPLKNKLNEGQYVSCVEVLIENRYFAPVRFNINLKQAIKVVAEAVRLPEKRIVPKVSVTASAPVVVRKSSPVVTISEPKPVVIEAPVKLKPVPEPKLVAPVLTSRMPKPTTLRERRARRDTDQTVLEGEELIKELARSFVRQDNKK